MFWLAWIGIAAGAGVGALLRWRLAVMLNPIFPTLPLGTLAANLLGGLLMGLVMEFLAVYTTVPVSVRLAMTTGFLGGLTTFSTFSADTVNLLLRGESSWAMLAVAAHVIGSLSMTIAGVYVVRLLLMFKEAL
jgi:fluoride exporter